MVALAVTTFCAKPRPEHKRATHPRAPARDNEFPGSATIHREGTNASIGVSIILYTVPEEKENPRVIFVLRDGKYFLFELWSVQGRYVVTAEFEHRGEASEQQRQVPLAIVESHDE